MKKRYFYLLILFSLSNFNNLIAQSDKFELEKNDKLSKFFDLKTVKEIEITNWHKTRKLTKNEIKIFIEYLSSYYFTQFSAPTKPGHLTGKIIFENKKELSFYSNSNSDIIFHFYYVDYKLVTFKTNKKIDFEKY